MATLLLKLRVISHLQISVFTSECSEFEVHILHPNGILKLNKKNKSIGTHDTRKDIRSTKTKTQYRLG